MSLSELEPELKLRPAPALAIDVRMKKTLKRIKFEFIEEDPTNESGHSI